MAIFDYIILFGVIAFVFLLRDHIIALIKDIVFSIVLYAGVIFLLGGIGVKLPISVEVNGLFICIVIVVFMHFYLNKSNPRSLQAQSSS